MSDADAGIPAEGAVPVGAPGEAPVVDPYHLGEGAARETPPKAAWKRALGWAKWVVSAALIAWVLSRTDIAAIGEALRTVRPWYIVGAFALIPLGVVIGAFRWQWLLRANGVRASIPYLIGGGCVAAFVRLFLPSTIGGDAVRVYDSWRAGASKSLAFATIGVDRLLGLFALVLLAFGAMAFNEHVSSIPAARWFALAAAGGMLSIIAWIFFVGERVPGVVLQVWRVGPAPVRRPFEKLFSALVTFHGKHGTLASVFSLGVVLQLNVVAFYWLIARGLGLEITFLEMLATAPIAVFVMMIPVSINGIGLRENVWILLLGAYGFAKADAVALSWIELGLFVLFGLLGGIVYAARK